MKYSNRSSTRFRKVSRSLITIIILLIVCFILVKATWNIYEKSKLIDRRLSRTKEQVAKLEQRYEILNQKVSLLSTDEGVEAEMRTKYRAVREGELVAVIVGEEKIATTATPIFQPSFWQRMLQLFGAGD